jgi:FkbH-like protein
MHTEALHAVVVADFNAANFAACLAQEQPAPSLSAALIPYERLAAGAGVPGGDIAVVWTRPEAVSAAYAAWVSRGSGRVDDVLIEVDHFASRVGSLRDRFAHLIVIGWMPPALNEAFASLAMRDGCGLSNLTMRMNLRLAECLGSIPGALLLDAGGWRHVERSPEEAKLWYAAKVPYRTEVFRRAARQVKSSLHAARGRSRKLIVLDLDDTLWGGLVGEVGPAGLRLGGHDAVGEAFVDFQRTLRSLKERGLLLAVASKNDAAVAMEALEHHPEMVLRRSDFAACRINWDDKAANIAGICDELNIGLHSTVFIDDSPVERARVSESLPEVLVPEWPASPLLYVDRLISLGCFDTVLLTDEDRARSELYARERLRSAARAGLPLDEWVRRLDLRVDVEILNERNFPRAVQLLNKTNQMNLSTRRLDQGQLTAWLRSGHRRIWTFRVGDRFGDAGLTGLASVDIVGRTAVLTDFVLSCRVFGRRVESAMLATAVEWARETGALEMVAEFRPTSKNGPCLAFLERSGLEQPSTHRFTWDCRTALPFPTDMGICTASAVGP